MRPALFYYKELSEIMHARDLRGVQFRSLQEQMDTTIPGGKLIFHVFGALAEFERAVICERTYAGINAARACGRLAGRPHKLIGKQLEEAIASMSDRNIDVGEIAKTFGVSRPTLYRAVKNVLGDRTKAACPN